LKWNDRARAIEGSLLHLVRNAVDHGLEKPEVRDARQESLRVIRLTAAHSGGNIIVTLPKTMEAGFDRERILDKARRVGLVSAERRDS